MVSFPLTVLAGFILGLLVVSACAPALGLRTAVVTSGSMRPAVSISDVVVLRTPSHPVRTGSIVMFHDAALAGALVTHRVVAVLPDGRLRTKGDANRLADSTPVPTAAVVGVAVAVVPRAGTLVVWARQQPGRLVVLALAGPVAIACLGIGRRRPGRPSLTRGVSRPS